MAEPLKTNGNGAAEGGANSGFASEKMQSPPRRLQRFDSLHTEAGMIPGGQSHAAKVCSSVLPLLFFDQTVVFIFIQTQELHRHISFPVTLCTFSYTLTMNSHSKIKVRP
jgi:KUP system potassium uptake protein